MIAWLNLAVSLVNAVLLVFAIRNVRRIRRDLDQFTEALSFERNQAEALNIRVVNLERRPPSFLDPH